MEPCRKGPAIGSAFIGVVGSVAKEQPQQDDYRYRNGPKVEQKSSRRRVFLSSHWDGSTRREGSFRRVFYQWPVFGIEVQGSAGGFGSPFCSSSIECRSGERTNAMLPSRGGRLMVMPSFIRRSQVA